MSEGLERAAGDRMREMLGKLTNNRVKGVLVGMGITMVIQSSSATTVTVVGFINAGLLQLQQAVGIIMGAEIGTTVTAQIIAVKLTDIAPIFVFVGAICFILFKNRSVKRFGEILAGFGILFLGMKLLAGAMEPLKTDVAFQHFMVNFQSPFVGILTGLLVTCIIQSSSVSIGILQALAMQGLIPLSSAVFVVLGCNIGTCITAVLASLSANTDSKRAAIIHASFNTIGTIIFSVLLAVLPIVDWLQSLSPDNVARQIANFHTLFNTTNVILMLPFAHLLVKLAKTLLPNRKDDDCGEDERALVHINETMLEAPAVAVDLVHEELNRMGRLARRNFSASVKAFFNKDDALVEKVLRREKNINYINHEIIRYLVKCSSLDLSDKDRETIGSYFHVVGDMERIGDHAENIAGYTITRIDEKLKFTDEALAQLRIMTEKVEEIIDVCLDVFAKRDESRLGMVEALDRVINRMQVDFKQSHIDRLSVEVCFPKSGVIFTDMISELERAADHAKNIAYSLRPIKDKPAKPAV
ncbi:MAG: Na/Pi cotransporter family protein [Bacillota bacterium]